MGAVAARGVWLLFVATAASWVVHRVLALAPGTRETLPDFGGWLLDALTGDLGESTRYRVGAGVLELLGTTSQESFRVVGLALLFSMLGAGALATVWSGRRPGPVASGSRGLTYLVSASPAFLLAYWTMIGVNAGIASGAKAGWWVPPSWFPVPNDVGYVRYVLAAAVLALGSGMLMEAARSLTAEIRRVTSADFVLFARAGGQPLYKHVVPGLLGPIFTLTLNRLTALFGGAVIVEVIFNVPGLGRLTWDAALMRDSHLLLGASLVWALLYAGARLVADVGATLADTRRRRAATEAA